VRWVRPADIKVMSDASEMFRSAIKEWAVQMALRNVRFRGQSSHHDLTASCPLVNQERRFATAVSE
jgi:hypothetical protein